MTKELPDDYIEWLRNEVKLSKRARLVVDYLLENGSVTTAEIREWGYDHPPRAIRDVRDAGVPVKTTMVIVDGSRMGQYTLVHPDEVEYEKQRGRSVIPKQFKNRLAEEQGACCAVCGEKYEKRYLQVDHRVPYAVAGESDAHDRDPTNYMLLCGSCNRAKSWSCEHCDNFLEYSRAEDCRCCYWGSPAEYTHVALSPVRRLTISWSGDEVTIYDHLHGEAQAREISLPEFVKRILAEHLEEKS